MGQRCHRVAAVLAPLAVVAMAPYTGAVVRIDSIHAYPGLIGATRPAA
jgi:hypothetical protein